MARINSQKLVQVGVPCIALKYVFVPVMPPHLIEHVSALPRLRRNHLNPSDVRVLCVRYNCFVSAICTSSKSNAVF